MAIYMKLDGVKGDATLGTGPMPERVSMHMIEQAAEENYKDWMVLNSISWNITNPITTRSGTDADVKGAKTPKVSEVTIKKDFDTASANLVKTICKENTPRTCRIRFVRTDFIGQHYLEYTFNKVLLTHWSTATEKDGEPNEEIHLNFTSFEMHYHPADAENVMQAPQRAEYDTLKK